MLLDLKAHYLDLIIDALEANEYTCLHRPNLVDNGRIYVVRSTTNTAAVAVVSYDFDEERVALKVERTDWSTPDDAPLLFAATYVKGLALFWPPLARKLHERRLANEPSAAPAT